MVGWKDILRPIRDGLRDQFPSKPSKTHDEDAEKRRRQREADIAKGFAYFDTFAELDAWSPENVDPIQIANTPLLHRPKAPIHDDGPPKAKVTLIHDYSGNYHDYEASQSIAVAKPQYSCEHLRYVDSFVYFSHKLVCVPPPTWTNTLHRNGVRSLGTFLVEPQSTDVGKIIERTASSKFKSGWEYPLATKLVQMAKLYGFEGWLLNIEKTFPYAVWDREKMAGFLAQLRLQLGHGRVIWYDALTTNNTLNYQNGLTSQNLVFAKAAGMILTNYDWTLGKITQARELALANGMDLGDIIFGIDVWAQNSHPKQVPRRTFGGGGTNTGVAVAKLAEAGFSAGIFAPAWPFEHFSNATAAVQRAMWEGVRLPKDLICDCEPQGKHDTGEYTTHPIARFAQEICSGSDSFFYTDFERAFTRDVDSGDLVSQLGSMSIQPRLHSYDVQECPVLTGTLYNNPSRVSIALSAPVSMANIIPTSFATDITLFNLHLTGPITIHITLRKPPTPPDLHLTVEFIGGSSRPEHVIHLPSHDIDFCTVHLEHGRSVSTPDVIASLPAITALKVGLSVARPDVEVSYGEVLLEILEVKIVPRERAPRDCAIISPVLTRRHFASTGDESGRVGMRLAWGLSVDGCPTMSGREGDSSCGSSRNSSHINSDEIDDDDSSGSTTIILPDKRPGISNKNHNSVDTLEPYSSVTGPISHFRISIDDKPIGRAYALEFVFNAEILRTIRTTRTSRTMNTTSKSRSIRSMGEMQERDIVHSRFSSDDARESGNSSGASASGDTGDNKDTGQSSENKASRSSKSKTKHDILIEGIGFDGEKLCSAVLSTTFCDDVQADSRDDLRDDLQDDTRNERTAQDEQDEESKASEKDKDLKDKKDERKQSWELI